jgi:sulfhydrogenase subunit beta (sulfur reductase)
MVGMLESGGVVLLVPGLQRLIDLLRKRGWVVMGPTVRDGVVVHGEIESVDQLPRGMGDLQDAGSYRLRQRGDDALFGYAVGPQAWKALLFPARELLWSGRRSGDEVEVDAAVINPPRLALFGVRSCDLHAIAIHDRVLAQRAVTDAAYVARRKANFVVAVTCSAPGGTCFCVSMGTGPVPDEGYDLALTELLDDAGHRFLLVSGSDRGSEVLEDLRTRAAVGEVSPAGEGDHLAAREVGAQAAQNMGRSLETDGLRDLLYANTEHPQWDDGASRCLSCTNCTLVCPTCFCTSVDEVSDLTGSTTERWRVWDSCFTTDFSYLHGGSVRTSVQSRYRQWATHKLASWVDQFGTSGCVGCGRCIAWCPAAIDLTAEVAAIRSGKARNAHH